MLVWCARHSEVLTIVRSASCRVDDRALLMRGPDLVLIPYPAICK